MSMNSQEVVHELTADGRERHHFQRDGALWICQCGEQRDSFGRVLPMLPYLL